MSAAPRGTCTRPPDGWGCTKKVGHAGPCPTRENRWELPILSDSPRNIPVAQRLLREGDLCSLMYRLADGTPVLCAMPEAMPHEHLQPAVGGQYAGWSEDAVEALLWTIAAVLGMSVWGLTLTTGWPYGLALVLFSAAYARWLFCRAFPRGAR